MRQEKRPVANHEVAGVDGEAGDVIDAEPSIYAHTYRIRDTLKVDVANVHAAAWIGADEDFLNERRGIVKPDHYLRQSGRVEGRSKPVKSPIQVLKPAKDNDRRATVHHQQIEIVDQQTANLRCSAAGRRIGDSNVYRASRGNVGGADRCRQLFAIDERSRTF